MFKPKPRHPGVEEDRVPAITARCVSELELGALAKPQPSSPRDVPQIYLHDTAPREKGRLALALHANAPVIDFRYLAVDRTRLVRFGVAYVHLLPNPRFRDRRRFRHMALVGSPISQGHFSESSEASSGPVFSMAGASPLHHSPGAPAPLLAPQDSVEFFLGLLGLSKDVPECFRHLDFLVSVRYESSGLYTAIRIPTNPGLVFRTAFTGKAVTREYRANLVAAWRHLSL